MRERERGRERKSFVGAGQGGMSVQCRPAIVQADISRTCGLVACCVVDSKQLFCIKMPLQLQSSDNGEREKGREGREGRESCSTNTQ